MNTPTLLNIMVTVSQVTTPRATHAVTTPTSIPMTTQAVTTQTTTPEWEDIDDGLLAAMVITSQAEVSDWMNFA